jgi:small subunit ribosomal protein S16
MLRLGLVHVETLMIKLRLKRFGKKNQSSFRIVAVNSTSRRDGEPLEELGFYNPRTKQSNLEIEKIQMRIQTGAQPSETVKSLLKKSGIV